MDQGKENHANCVINVMAKPCGAKCNIQCDYCFYLEKQHLYKEINQQVMPESTLKAFIAQNIEANNSDEVSFIWQGGEPTLAGLDFYRRVVEIQHEYKGKKNITNFFQTNGIALNDSWCRFFKKNNFIVGISIDGPKHLHDLYRKTKKNNGTFDKVMCGIYLLKKYQINFNTLTVINDANVEFPLEIYAFLKETGSSYLQFIPLVERKSEVPTKEGLYFVDPDHTQAKVTKWSVSPHQYGQFLTRIFDEWVTNDVGKVYVQMFEVTLAAWMGLGNSLCIFSDSCQGYVAMEANGDVYGCDHFVYPHYLLGNIHQNSLQEICTSNKAVLFGQKKSMLNRQCLNCKFLPVCGGGCPKHRFAVSNKKFPKHNYFCESYFHFFEHVTWAMNVMVDMTENNIPIENIMSLVHQEKLTLI
ncbi:anaerobic sulfatase maturase [Vibrio mimicus]